MNEITAHRVQKVGIFINNVLIVKKEFVRFQQLLLFDHQLVGIFIVFHYLVILHIIVWNRLASEHDQCILVHHVQAHQPYATVDNCVENYPRIPLDV